MLARFDATEYRVRLPQVTRRAWYAAPEGACRRRVRLPTTRYQAAQLVHPGSLVSWAPERLGHFIAQDFCFVGGSPCGTIGC